MSLASGERVGPYEVVALLGAGGMGEVYRARDSRLGRAVAIKVLPAPGRSDPEALRRFEQEARAAGALNHPNVLAVLDVGTHGGQPYAVSELLEGETLRDRMGNKALTLRKALEIAIQMANGLAAAHEKGIVHRDIKPENLFLTREGQLKILDFGLAKVVTNEQTGSQAADGATASFDTDIGKLLGTVGYMSPEQVRGLPTDARSDIFSFGTVLYEMIGRRRAFRGETPAETMTAILRAEPPLLAASNATIPPMLDLVVRRCMEKDPGERFQSVRDVAFALEVFAPRSGTETTPALPPSFWRKHMLVVVAGGALLLGVTAGLFGGKPVWQVSPLRFTQLTFRRGTVWAARFAPDGQTIVYTAAWEGKPSELFSTRPESPESRSLDLPDADILAISSTGEMALALGPYHADNQLAGGTLARAPLGGGAPREVLQDTPGADWTADGKDLAVVRQGEGRWRVEFPVGKTLFQSDALLCCPRVSPRGDSVAFLEFAPLDLFGGTLLLVDRAGRSTRLFTGPPSLRSHTWSPLGSEIWFTRIDGSGATTVQAVTPSGQLRLMARLPGTMRILDGFRDGRLLMVRNDPRTSLIGRPSLEEPERDLSWQDASAVADISSDGRTLVFNETRRSGGRGTVAVYLRKLDGSPAVRLGEGRAWALSLDLRSVLATTSAPHPEFVVLPTGAGEVKHLPNRMADDFRGAAWFPDGRRFVFAGKAPGEGARLFVQSIAGEPARPLTAAGTHLSFPIVSPDGLMLAASSDDGSIVVLPVADGMPRRLPGSEGEVPVQWSSDNRSLYVYNPEGPLPARIFHEDVFTGQRHLWKEITIADPAGLDGRVTVVMTPNAKTYAYSFTRTLSELYLVEGLK